MAGMQKTGMQMMLASLGIDPAQIENIAVQIPAYLKQQDERFQKLESKLDRVLSILESEVIETGPDPRQITIEETCGNITV
jgi:hypothetical protein